MRYQTRAVALAPPLLQERQAEERESIMKTITPFVTEPRATGSFDNFHLTFFICHRELATNCGLCKWEMINDKWTMIRSLPLAVLYQAALFLLLIATAARAQQQEIPREWTDTDTGHRVIRLSDEPGIASL